VPVSFSTQASRAGSVLVGLRVDWGVGVVGEPRAGVGEHRDQPTGVVVGVLDDQPAGVGMHEQKSAVA
jgi:hypothetical protein